MDGLGVELLAGAALRLQQHGGVGGGDLLGQGLHRRHRGGDRHDVVKGVPGAVGLVQAAEDLLALGLHGVQLLAGAVGVLQEGDHRDAADEPFPLIDGVHVDEVEVLDLLAGLVEDGLSLLQHVGEPGAGPQVPQTVALDGADVASGLLVEEVAVGPVAEDDDAVGIDDGDALAHGVESGAGGGVELHGTHPPDHRQPRCG